MQYPKISNNKNSWIVPEVQALIKVEEDVPSSVTKQTNVSVVSDSDQTNLIINYLPPDMSEQELFEIFGKFGDIFMHKIIRDRQSGESLGYGFVDFKSANAALVAQTMCDHYEIRGKFLKVAFARPRNEKIEQANLYVAYLPPYVDERKLSIMFGCYGTISDVRLLRCRVTGKSRCAGFVRFEQRLAAEDAIKALHNYVFKDGRRPISVQFANQQFKPPTPGSFSPIDDATDCVPTKRHIVPVSPPAAKRIQRPYPSSHPINHEMAKRSSEPYPIPLPVNRHMEPKVQQLQMEAMIQQRQMELEIQSAVKAPNPYPWLAKRSMKPEIEQAANRSTEPHISPPPVRYQVEPNIHQHQMEPKIQQHQMEPKIQQRLIDPRTKLPGKPSQAPNPYPWLVQRSIEPEIQMAINSGQAPNSYPRLVHRPIKIEIDQITERSEEQNTFPEPLMRHTEPKMQKDQMEPMDQQRPEIEPPAKPSQAPNPYPWLDKRPMKPEIELTDNRSTEPRISPAHVKYQMEPKIHQHQIEPKIQQRQIDPRTKPLVKPGQLPYPYPWLVKGPMDAEIDQINNLHTQPYLTPCSVNRHMEPKSKIQQRQMELGIEPPRQAQIPYPMEPEIDRVTKHREEPYPFPREMEPSVQKHRMEPTVQQRRKEPYHFPLPIKLEMESSIQEHEMEPKIQQPEI